MAEYVLHITIDELSEMMKDGSAQISGMLEGDGQEAGEVEARVYLDSGCPFDAWNAYPMFPEPFRFLMMALGHLSDLQEISGDELMNERVNAAKLLINNELQNIMQGGWHPAKEGTENENEAH